MHMPNAIWKLMEQIETTNLQNRKSAWCKELLKMANKKANEKRIFMRVPVSFNRLVMDKAKKYGVKATVMLENCDISYNDPRAIKYAVDCNGGE